MGAIEIQVFVSLVVILGAAFVALICDFLKGSNEQLREANIVMRVREDERDKRDDLVEKVQQQTIEVVAKVQGALVGRPVSAPVPAAQAAARTQQQPAAEPAPLVTPITDARELFERAQAERSARGRRGRRSEERATAKPREESVASWAQDIVIRKHQDVEPAKAPVAEPVSPVENVPVAETVPVSETVPADAITPIVETVPDAPPVPVEPAPLAIAVPAAQSTQQEFTAQPEEIGLPSATPALASVSAEVPMAPAQPLEQAPVATPPVQAVPEYTHLESPEAGEQVAVRAHTKQESEAALAMVEAQQLAAPPPLAQPVVAVVGSLQSAEVVAESVLPAVQQPAPVCQLSQATELSLGLAGPSALAAEMASLPADLLAAETESSLPALRLHTEVPEYEIVPPSVEQFAQTVEPLATLEVPSAESLPLMVAAAEDLPLETATLETPLVESAFEAAEVLESPVQEPVEALVAETAVAEAIEEVPQTVEVAEVLESPVQEPVEALVPEAAIAEAIEEVPQPVEVAEVLESPVQESVEALVPEAAIAEAIEAVPQTVEVAEVSESPVQEPVEALVPEAAIAEAIEEVPQTVEVAEVLESQVQEPVEALVPEAAIAEAIEEVPQTVEVAEVLESPVQEPVEALVPETAIAEAIEEVPQTVEVAEVLESPVQETVEALVPEIAATGELVEASFTADYSLIEDMPVYAEIPTLSRVEAEEPPVVEPVAETPAELVAEDALVSHFEPTIVESGVEEEIHVVRIRVLRDDDVLPVSEFTDTAVSLGEHSASSYSQFTDEVEPEVAPIVAEQQPEPVAEPEQAVPEMIAEIPVEPATEAEPLVAELTSGICAEPLIESEPVTAELVVSVWSEPVAEPEPAAAEMMAATWPEPVVEAGHTVESEPVSAEIMAVTSPEPTVEIAPLVAALTASTWTEPVAEAETVMAEPVAVSWPEQVVEAEPVTAELTAATWPESQLEAEPPVAEAASLISAPVETGYQTAIWDTSEEPSTWDLQQEDTRPEPAFTDAVFTESEPVFASAAPSGQAAADDPFSYRPAEPEPVVETPAPVIPQSEMRPKVVEMRSAAQVRAEQEPPAPPTLELPGGFHEPTALARLLEDEAPFSGLVIAVSVVDYVRLMADQGKPAIEQIMGSVTRLVMSLTREQDFACRIAEDEFILIFARENGSAAKRRIQLVSERLWDYQLRSLGSVSIIFSWGASESQTQPIVHAVENAREQMLETRRNRRNLTGVSRRFGRQAANS
ncbi:MAG: diguanylate cyclase [Acidobacteria bacterium]|nr:diguanylate cyclase [Acidobacteriota bacterium]